MKHYTCDLCSGSITEKTGIQDGKGEVQLEHNKGSVSCFIIVGLSTTAGDYREQDICFNCIVEEMIRMIHPRFPVQNKTAGREVSK